MMIKSEKPRSPTPDEDFVVRLRIVLSRLARRLNASAATAGLSPTQAAIFTSIGRHGPIGLSRLANVEGVNPSMLSRVVAKLEHAGLVERLADPGDGRAFLVQLTPLGVETHGRIRTEKGVWLRERLEQLGPERTQSLIEALPALEELVAHLREPASRDVDV